MNFSKLSDEVIYSNILPKLPFEDVLSLRSVDKRFKRIAEDFLLSKPSCNRLIQFNVDSLAEFMKLSFVIPSSGYSFMNFSSALVPSFISTFGSHVKELHIASIKVGDKLALLNDLTALERLTIDLLDENVKDQGIEQYTFLNRLRKLEVKAYYCTGGLDSVCWIWKLIEKALPTLVCLLHPTVHVVRRGYWYEERVTELLPSGGFFSSVSNFLRTSPKSCLQVYDLGNVPDAQLVYRNMGNDFLGLVTACAAHDVKLLNVNALLIRQMLALGNVGIGDLEKVVVSLRNFHGPAVGIDFSNLEGICIDDGAKCEHPVWDIPENLERPLWRTLKRLELTFEESTVRDMFNFFFAGIEREKVEDVNLSFDFEKPGLTLFPQLSTSCRNIKKLSVCGWSGSNHEISQIWVQLKCLETMSFISCVNLDITSFQGDDPTNPVFFRAMQLKRLTFSGLESMPNLDSAIVISILCHMPLFVIAMRSKKTVKVNTKRASSEKIRDLLNMFNN